MRRLVLAAAALTVAMSTAKAEDLICTIIDELDNRITYGFVGADSGALELEEVWVQRNGRTLRHELERRPIWRYYESSPGDVEIIFGPDPRFRLLLKGEEILVTPGNLPGAKAFLVRQDRAWALGIGACTFPNSRLRSYRGR